jgi:hypothetical protein
MRRPIWTSIFLSKTLVSANCCNIVVLFLAMVEKCSKTLIFCLLFCFVTSSRVIGLSKGFLLASSLEPLLKSIWNYGQPTISFAEAFTCFITFPLRCGQLSYVS